MCVWSPARLFENVQSADGIWHDGSWFEGGAGLNVAAGLDHERELLSVKS